MPFQTVLADIIAYLDPVDGAAVSSDVPNPRPTEFVQVRRIGGPAVVPVRETVRFDVFTWAATAPRAMELVGLVRVAFWELAGTSLLGYPVYGVNEFMGPAQADDVDTGKPRGWYRPEVTVRADEVIHYRAP